MEAMPHSYNLRSASKKQGVWSELPHDMLEMILKRLPTMPDCFRFGAVCSSWRRVMTERCNIMPPLLMLEISESRSPKQCCFFTFAYGKFCKLSATMTYPAKYHRRPTRCHGSYNGWLLINASRQTETISSRKYYLLNPITRSEIELPSDPGVTNVEGSTLSAVPTSTDCIAVVECLSYKRPFRKRLASCRPAVDSNWVVFPYPDDDVDFILSMTIYQGKLYTFMQKSGITRIYAFDSQPTLVGSVTKPVETILDKNNLHRQLVESEGELLLVVRTHNYAVQNQNQNQNQYSPKLRFFVYKLDEQACRWVKLESLGGRVLLLNDYSSESFSAENNQCLMGSQCFTGNCIYYQSKVYNWMEMIVFSMENECIIERIPLPKGSRYDVDWIVPQRLYGV